MRYTDLSLNSLNAISPTVLTIFARSLGFEKTDDYGKTSAVFNHNKHGEILVPITQNIGDYKTAVARVFERFVEILDDNELTVFNSIIGSEFDVIRFATESEDDGSIYLDNALTLHTRAKDMLLAAACSAKRPQASFRAGANKEAKEYLDKVRLAQSEKGSYVIKLHSPVPPRLQQVLIEEPIDEQPYERQVTSTLMSALAQSEDIIKKAITGNADDLNLAVQNGVSANLCEGMAKILADTRELKISTTWSKLRPKQRPITSISFSDDAADYFKEFARVLKDKEPQRDITLLASIHQLARQSAAVKGKIFFNAIIDDESRTVTAELNEESYSKAVAAHELREMVEFSGDLERAGSRWILNRALITNVLKSSTDDE